MQTHVPKGVQGGIWTFPQWLKIFEPRIVPCLTLREKYMQTRVPTMVQGGRALHTSYMICNDTEDENGRGSPSVGPKSNEYGN